MSTDCLVIVCSRVNAAEGCPGYSDHPKGDCGGTIGSDGPGGVPWSRSAVQSSTSPPPCRRRSRRCPSAHCIGRWGCRSRDAIAGGRVHSGWPPSEARELKQLRQALVKPTRLVATLESVRARHRSGLRGVTLVVARKPRTTV